ncbi:MAG: FtsX-like permease family protein, partial [Micropruina sp.]
PRDVTNGRTGQGGERVAAWPVQGDLTKVFQLVRGRMPRPGEAVVSSTALRKLGLAEPVGYVATDSKEQYPIVGAFLAIAPFADLGESIILNAADQPQARELRVVIATIADVRPTQNSILTILAPADPQGVYIESPSGLADTAQELGGQLAGFGRSLLLLILGVGAFFVATVVLSDVLVRRRDLGRRRTLGITRSFLTALVTIRTIGPAATGALVGTVTALIVNVSTGTPIPTDFAQAVGVLAVITAAAAAIPPAWYAAQRDPVDVMRTP